METTRTAGFILCAAAAATVVAMAFHPSDAHAGGLANLVHASMIVLLTTMGWGFLQFSRARGAWNGWVSAGLAAYAVSVFGHLVAGTINGFVVPALINPEAPVSHDIFRFAWHANQAFAKLGMIAGSVAYLLWSIDLLRDRAGRLLGIAGVGIGIAVPLLLLTGFVRLDVHGALLLYGLQALWAVMAGVEMIRGRIQPSGYSATSS